MRRRQHLPITPTERVPRIANMRAQQHLSVSVSVALSLSVPLFLSLSISLSLSLSLSLSSLSLSSLSLTLTHTYTLTHAELAPFLFDSVPRLPDSSLPPWHSVSGAPQDAIQDSLIFLPPLHGSYTYIYICIPIKIGYVYRTPYIMSKHTHKLIHTHEHTCMHAFIYLFIHGCMHA